MAHDSSTPAVRLEFRQGAARPTVYDVTGDEFVVGTAPGCDVRLAGSNLPPIICMISRHAGGVRIRKLAPTTPLLLNGKSFQSAELHAGDKLTLGTMSIDVQVAVADSPPRAVSFIPVGPAAPLAADTDMDDRRRKLEEQAAELESDRVLWYRRRQELEAECRERESALADLKRQQPEAERARRDQDALVHDLAAQQDVLDRLRQELLARQNDLTRREKEIETGRQADEKEQHRRDQLFHDATSSVDKRIAECERREQHLAEQAARAKAESGRLELLREDLDRRERESAGQGITHERLKQLERDAYVIDERLRNERQARQQCESQLQALRGELDGERRTLAERDAQLRAQVESLDEQRREVEQLHAELTEIRRELEQRYQSRRDRLAGVQQAVQTAAFKVQERKRRVDADEQTLGPRLRDLEARAADIERREAALSKSWEELACARQSDEAMRLELAAKARAALEHVEARESDCNRRELQITSRESQYQSDLARLDRHNETLEHRERQAEAQSADAERKREQLRRDSMELEEQARQLDAAATAQRAEAEKLAADKVEFQTAVAQLKERAAQVESQQAALAALRTRLERTRDEVRQEAQVLAEQRVRQEAAERDLKDRIRSADALQASIDAEGLTHVSTQQQFEARSAELHNAVVRLRELQEKLTEQEAALQQRQAQLEAQADEQASQSTELKTKTDQLVEMQQSLAADRQTLLEREAALTETEETRKSLQEQLLRRAEEIAARQKQIEDRERDHEIRAGQVGEQHEITVRQREAGETAMAAARQELDRQMAEIQRQALRLGETEAGLRRQAERIKSAGRALAAGRKSQAQARVQWLAKRRAADAETERLRAEIEEVRRLTTADAAALQQQLPDLELRGQAVLVRLGQAREEIRGQLAELHEYARQSQEDLEELRSQLRTEAERLREQEVAIKRARAEHRLAVAAFRQQLLEWQNRTADMRRMLTDDGTRLEWKQAEVAAAAKHVDETAQHLAKQAADLHEQERQVGERRGEMERHLSDMREWYRRKLRELAQTGGEVVRLRGGESLEPSIVPIPGANETAPARGESADQEPSILSLTRDLDPGDRQLGELLRKLELIDGDTLTALLLEARRQRRSLRQVLLSARGSGTPMLTLYQLALIESGNLDALVLGPTRVIDRLQSTAHEAVFRVFDPRRGGTVFLRHLAEAEMQHTDHVSDFRDRFTALAAIDDPHLAATLEVLEVNGRPAVLQECLSGLPSSEWPAAAAVPSVWRRLVMQVADGLNAVHQAGIVHGRLSARSVILTADGTVKLMGCGEPPWLSGANHIATVADDLKALGVLAAAWATITPRRKGARAPKPLPEALQNILTRLQSDGDDRYTSAADVLVDLERAGKQVRDSADAWEKLLSHSADNSGETIALRKSA